MSIEEFETANEELKASNEEITSMNEELQSTNEELETSHEELQSLNEELTTVNRQLEEKLSELETANNDLLNLLTSTHIATLFLGLDLRIRRITPSCTEFLSIIESDIGRSITDLSLGNADLNLKSDLNTVISKLMPIEAEIRNERDVWFLRRILPYRTADNKIDGLVITYTDINGLKQTTRALEIREHQQASVVALGRIALSQSDIDALLKQAANAVAEQLDCEFSEILSILPSSSNLKLHAGTGWKDREPGQIICGAGIESFAGYALQISGPVIVDDFAKEKRFTLPDKKSRQGLVSGAAVLIGPGDHRWGALCVFSGKQRAFSIDDMNYLQSVANVLPSAIVRARSEEDVKVARSQLAGILDNADDAIISIDQNQSITMFNHGAEKIFGYTAQELLGKPLDIILPSRFRDSHHRHIGEFGKGAAALARRMGERGDIFGRRKDASEFPAEASISKLETSWGVTFTAILRDITEHKRLEALLEARVAERTDELKKEMQRREEAQEALVRSQKLQGLGELAGGMAHDFNNLLTVITGNLEILDEGIKDQASRELIQRAESAARMGARLIGRLLLFGRQRKLNETQNAQVQSGETATRIGLAPGDYVKLSVGDNGSGMSADVIARAFEPFFTTKGPGKGTGLGLATIYGFAQQSGGLATIESEVGKGTTVSLYLPKDAGSCSASEVQSPEKKKPSKSGAETVLVVEDNPDVRELTLQRLRRLGYKTIVADSGPAAILALGNNKDVDLVFSDVVMAGGMSGVDVARWVRINRPRAKILLTSGYAELADDDAVNELGIKILRKPYKQADLGRAIEEALQG